MDRQKSLTGLFACGAVFTFVTAAIAQTPPPIPTGTVGRPTALPSATAQMPQVVYQAGGGPFSFATPFTGTSFFELLWARTDLPVKRGLVERAWLWGPGPNTPGLLEQYNEDPLGRGMRLVQYFDKSRMEINDPQSDNNRAGYITNGLLAAELISGFIQVGEASSTRFRPACIPMTGDPEDQTAPTYASFQGVSNTQAGEHRAPNLTGRRVTATINRQGVVGNDPSKADVRGVDLAQYEAETGHNIPRVFWDFLLSQGEVYKLVYDGGRLHNDETLTTEPLGLWQEASGLPISEPYWTRAMIAGRMTDVMLQAYERRVLTYVPSNPDAFKVEVANIGQHYFEWRYRNYGICPGTTPGTPTPPVVAPTGTPLPGATRFVPGTPAPPRPTGSITPGTPLPLPTGTVTPIAGP